MGQVLPHSPALLLLAAFSRSEGALQWARRRASDTWGPIELESPRFEFRNTNYYEPTMGKDLQKTFFLFADLFDPSDLVEIKLQTNRWEEEYAAMADTVELRPLNLDPGYVCLGKLVLASTKDHAHRIYMARGIYGEVTLNYRDRQWRPRQWTFADYRRDDYHAFFSECRKVVYRHHREASIK